MSSDISILFSGGPDSTLTVLKALTQADRIHLITYHHHLMSHDRLSSGKKKNSVVIEELQDKYGSRRIIVYTENINKAFKKIYYNEFFRFISKYHSYCIPWICGACKLTMHAATIYYNCIHNISLTYDGANKESSAVFPAQHPSYIRIVKAWYRSHNMIYETPVYDIKNTDLETEAYGLCTCRNTKKEHVFFSTQHSCIAGLLLHSHSRFYYNIFRDKDILGKTTPLVLREKIPIAEKIVFCKHS